MRSAEDTTMHVEVELTHAFINPTPTSSQTAQGNKHTAVLKQLAPIFNIPVHTKVFPPETTAPTQEEAYGSLRVVIPEATPEAAPAPLLRVQTTGQI